MSNLAIVVIMWVLGMAPIYYAHPSYREEVWRKLTCLGKGMFITVPLGIVVNMLMLGWIPVIWWTVTIINIVLQSIISYCSHKINY